MSEPVGVILFNQSNQNGMRPCGSVGVLDHLLDSAGAVVATATSVAIAGEVVTVRFASVPEDAAMIAYQTPTTNPPQDSMGNRVASFEFEL